MTSAAPRPHRLRAWRGLALAALACAACPRRDPPPTKPRLVEVRVVPERGSGLDAAALAALATERVRAGGWIEVAPGAAARGPGDVRLTVEIGGGVTAEPRGEHAVVRVRSALRPVDKRAPAGVFAGPIQGDVLGEKARADGGVAADEVAALAARALADAMDQLGRLARVHLGGPGALLAALSDEDAAVREEGVRVAAARREAAAVPRLIELLAAGDPDLRDLALGALVEIGDRRAVKPITRIAKTSDARQLPKIVDALGALGGDEARAYLDFVISAHDDDAMRELATEARRRLVEREAAGQGSPPTDGAGPTVGPRP